MAKKKVCCSFDYEHDRIYYNLLEAWNENDDINFSINDCTPSEIQSESVSTIKQVLSTKIGQANYMIAIVGKHSNDKHPDSEKIGYSCRNGYSKYRSVYRIWFNYRILFGNRMDSKCKTCKTDQSNLKLLTSNLNWTYWW